MSNSVSSRIVRRDSPFTFSTIPIPPVCGPAPTKSPPSRIPAGPDSRTPSSNFPSWAPPPGASAGPACQSGRCPAPVRPWRPPRTPGAPPGGTARPGSYGDRTPWLRSGAPPCGRIPRR